MRQLVRVPRPAEPGAPEAATVVCAVLCAVLSTGCAAAAGFRAGAADAAADADGPAAARARVTPQITAMMTRSAAAWNRGDLDAFVDDYAPGGETTYIGRRGIVRGPAAIRAVYAPRFAPGVRRGTLRFEAVEVDVLAPGVANVIATYVLSERTAAGADSTVARGPTSLVMRRGAGGRWRIVHDHSS